MNNIFIDLREYSSVKDGRNYNLFDKVYLGHRTLLGSNIRYSKNSDFPRSLYDGLHTEELDRTLDLKSQWLENPSTEFRDGFSNALAASDLSPILAKSMVNYLLTASGGCFDALMFVKGMLANNEKAQVTVAMGGNYSQNEIIVLAWWIHLCNFLIVDDNISLAFEFSELGQTHHTVDIQTIFEFILRHSVDRPRIVKIASKQPSLDNHFSKLICLRNCKDKLRWIEFLCSQNNQNNQNNNFTLIDQPNILSSCGEIIEIHFEKSLVSNHNKILEKNKYLLFENLREFEKLNFKVGGESPSLLPLVENFIIEFGVKYISGTIAELVGLLRETINNQVYQDIYITDCPSIEVMAVHQLAIERDIDLTLLPHSFTPIHEVEAGSFRNTFCYSSSNEIVPNPLRDSLQCQKERVFDREYLLTHFATNQFVQPKDLKGLMGSAVPKIIHFLKSGTVKSRVFNQYLKFINNRNYRKSLLKNKFKVGYVQNANIDSFSNTSDFNNEFILLLELNQLIDQCYSERAGFFIRGKNGFFSKRLCLNFFGLRGVPKSKCPTFDDATHSIQDFGQKMDLILFSSSTSAILELMLEGVACLCLRDPSYTVFSQYLVYPEHIVPRLTLEEMKHFDVTNLEQIDKIRLVQKEWARKQTVVTI